MAINISSTFPSELVDQQSTEERVRASAIKHFAAKGYDATSIRDIIEDAGVTRPVLYYYFKNKEDLFIKLIAREFEQGLRELDDAIAAGSDFRDKLIRIMAASFERAEKSPELVQMMLQFFFSPPDAAVGIDRRVLANQRVHRVARLIQEGLDSGEIAGGDAYSLTLVFSGIMDMHIMAKSDRPEGRLAPELAESLVDLFLNGVRSGASLRHAIKSGFDFHTASIDVSGR